ncbi:ABC1 family, putative [Trypanosoma equiperdum]|uniref:ABC1 family, putative n=1 Tax=Trypanosoma equiperdum TaxID=5694 RepID=A0A1G4I7M7_TRYEQ|nr:ABC1 family, putative [Trypanosoma equiperdum]
MMGRIRVCPQPTYPSVLHLFCIGGVTALTACGGALLLYYRGVWVPERRRLLQQQTCLPPRRTRQFIAGSGSYQQQVAVFQYHPHVLREILFCGLVVLRTILLVVHMVPVIWFTFLTYGLHFCSEPVFFGKVRDMLLAMGPSYIKLGQWIATRPDIFSPVMCSALEKLYDNTEPHSWSHTEKTLRNTFRESPQGSNDEGRKGDTGTRQNVLYYLREIEKVPVNSGSIAQVHRAVLREDVDGVPTGTTVAIKILHPLTREIICADLFVMKCFVNVVTTLFRDTVYLDLRRALGEFSSLLCSQLSLDLECDNLKQFAFNFRDFPGVIFPKPLPSFCTPDVLVETFEEGRPLQEIQPCDEFRDAAQRGCHMFLKMLFEDNFVHSDLHPGNILIRANPGAPLNVPPTTFFSPTTVERYPDGKPKLKYELIILDAGLTTSLSPEERNNFISLFAAVACGDGSLGADLMIDRLPPDVRPPYPEAKREKFRMDMTNIFNTVAPGASDGFTLRHVRIGSTLCKIMNTLRENKTPIDGNFASLVLTVVVGEGLGRKLIPDFNLFAEAVPYLMVLLEDNELSYLANKLRSTYGAGTLLRDSLSLVELQRTPTYIEAGLRKASKTVDRILQQLTRQSAVTCASQEEKA